MNHVVVGLSHQTAVVEVRERLAIPTAAMPDVLARLARVDGVVEALLVSTCNRTEIYATVDDGERDAARLSAFLAELAKVPPAELDGQLYRHLRGDAVRHVFRVAASLDSMVVGESQILGQVKASYAAAQAAETAGAGLGRLMERAFAVAKKVRVETMVGRASVSVSSIAVDLARTIFGDLTGRSVLLIGAGKIGRLTLRYLREAGVGHLYVANRTRERALSVLEAFDADAASFVPLERVLEPLEKVDVALSSVEVDHYLFDRAAVHALQRRRRGRPLFLVDIAVPRSLDPSVHEEENVFLYDIDDLRGVVERNLSGRREEAQRAERIVERESTAFSASLKELDVVPAIRDLLDHLEGIRRAELERHAPGLGPLDEAARAAVDAATRGIVKKIAHGAIAELKRSANDPHGAIALETIRRALFGGRAGAGRRQDPEER